MELLFLIFLNLAKAEGLNCLQLEGLNIGCISSVDHACYMNKKVDDPRSPCTYVAEPSTMFRVGGPISFNCKSYRNTKVCTDSTGNNDQTGTVCTTTSECIEYQPPQCQETCVPCFNRVESYNVGLERGCIICTRPRCPDEKIGKVCPSSYNGMPLGKAEKCSANTKCPTTAIDPLGVQHNVIVNVSSCSPPDVPNVETPPPPEHCPWKVDKRTQDGCEPIEPDNQNP